MNRLHNTRILIGLATLATTLTFTTTANAATHPKVGVDKNRTIELVSTPNKTVPVANALLSADGNKVLYRVLGGTDDTTVGTGGTLLATRTPTGWKSNNPLPTRQQFGVINTDDLSFHGASPSFEDAIVLGAPGIGGTAPAYLARYSLGTGEIVPGVVLPASAGLGGIKHYIASDDMRHVFTVLNLDPGKDPTKQALYDYGGTEPKLISRMPDGSLPTCGTSLADFAFEPATSGDQRWVSTNADRVFFHSQGDVCDGKRHLYMREGGADGTTTLISGPPVSGDDDGGRFVTATPDGSQAFFTTGSKLDLSDANDGQDIYRYTVGVGNECLTCAVADAQVITDPAITATAVKVAVAKTGDRVYFTSMKALASGATEGVQNVYVWRKDEPNTLTFVAPVSSFTASSYPTAVTTSDGSVLMFQSDRPELDAMTGSSNGGVSQFYRYSDQDHTVQCVTCSPHGQAASGPGQLAVSGLFALLPITLMTHDGSSFFFDTRDSLVDEDVNAGRDIYEWRGGKVGLITDGRSPESYAQLYGASPDGREVLFKSDLLLADNAREGSGNLYVARVGGGFPEIPEVPECAGDQCQASPADRPDRRWPVVGGDTDDREVRRATFSTGRLSVAQRVALARGRSVIIGVRVNRAGVVRAGLGRFGSTVAKRAEGAGTVRLRLRLSSVARRRLVRGDRLAVVLTVRFAGVSQPRTQKLDLRRPR